MPQQMRPSQYVTTFGPGALLETPAGPHVLECTEAVIESIGQVGLNVMDLMIPDQRLEQSLLDGGRVFRLPSETVSDRFGHPATPFPQWNLCVKKHVLADKSQVNVVHRRMDGCPLCPEKEREATKHPRNSIRFLSACPEGHMDDVNWRLMIHFGSGSGSSVCKVNHFLWHGTGSSLSSIQLQCPDCGVRRTLGEVYQTPLKCTGKRPERRHASADDCEENSIVVQRGAFQLRVPEVVTSLTIPPLAGESHSLAQMPGVRILLDTLESLGEITADQFERAVKSNRELPKALAEKLIGVGWETVRHARLELSAYAAAKSKAEYLIQEHLAMEDAAKNGYPPRTTSGKREKVRFQVNASQIKYGVKPKGSRLAFRVMPIERLQVILVQKGYKRVNIIGPNSKLSSVAGRDPHDPTKLWYPGVDHYGEGIYIDIDPEVDEGWKFWPKGPEAERWEKYLIAQPRSTELLEWNCLSTWWHTLAHRLINAVALYSGYSSTAIRERVYYTDDDKGKRGGVVLYTTQSGGDGTMGGLTSLASNFSEIMEAAVENVELCSNDPLCADSDIDLTTAVGAACYSCLMVSETSCEHFNTSLHRGLLVENWA